MLIADFGGSPSRTYPNCWIGSNQAQTTVRQGSISAPRATGDPRYSVVASFRKDADHPGNGSQWFGN